MTDAGDTTPGGHARSISVTAINSRAQECRTGNDPLFQTLHRLLVVKRRCAVNPYIRLKIRPAATVKARRRLYKRRILVDKSKHLRKNLFLKHFETGLIGFHKLRLINQSPEQTVEPQLGIGREFSIRITRRRQPVEGSVKVPDRAEFIPFTLGNGILVDKQTFRMGAW